MRAHHLAAVAICTAIAASPAVADECTFATAIYKQSQTGYVLRFQPQERIGRFSSTNAFYLDSPHGKEPLFGWVTWNNGEGRPEGWLMKACPEDGMTNEDYASCTHWSGVMYALEDGNAVLLPKEWESPPVRILLPDLGRKLRYSALNYEDPPWDVFDFAGCGRDETK